MAFPLTEMAFKQLHIISYMNYYLVFQSSSSSNVFSVKLSLSLFQRLIIPTPE